MLIECAPQDSERTTRKLRGLFAAYGGHPGAQGSVAYLFNAVGLLTYAPAARLKHHALEAGAEDVLPREDALIDVITDPMDFTEVRAALSRAGHAAVAAVITRRAAITVELRGAQACAMRDLLRVLAQTPGVQDIHTNARFAE